MNSYIYSFYKNLKSPPFSLKIIGDEKIYDQEEILNVTKRVAVVLSEFGVIKGTRVAIISKNKPYFLFVLYALFYLKAIPVSIDYNHTEDTIYELTKEEMFLISDRKIKNYKGKFLSFSSLMDRTRNSNDVEKKFEKITANGLFEKVEENDPFIILCSSGTTALPKKVILSEKNILWADREYARLYNFKENKSIAFIVPTHYSLGILACGIIPFFHKKTILICDGKKIKNSLEKISTNKINILPATPTIYNLMNRCKLNKYDFSNLKICDSGGQPMPVAIIKNFAKKAGVFVTEGYGLTETSSLTHFLVKDKNENLRLGSMGLPCREVECKIVDEFGKQVELFVPGKLLVRGPQNMLGYSKTEDNKKIFTEDGWLDTGDIVYRDDENFYYYISREIDLLKHKFIDAKLIREIEEILYSINEIKECAVLVMKDKKIIIFIKLSSNRYEREKISKIVFDKLPENDFDIRIKLVSIIPRTSTHKVKRVILREKYK